MENSRYESWNEPQPVPESNKRIIAGVLAIVLGSFGIHKFVLGYTTEGIVLLVLTVIGYATMCLAVGFIFLSATALIGLIEGIIYLTKSDDEFYRIYQQGRKGWF